MQRRAFLQMGAAGFAAGVAAPQLLVAGNSSNKIITNAMAGGVYYTKSSPGRWAKKAGAHSPILMKTDTGIKIVTGHPMKPGKHWIVKHILLDKNFNFIDEKIFDPNKDKQAISHYKLKNVKGTYFALSVCNLHDTWLSMLQA